MTPDALFERLRALGIELETVEHPPVYTVEEAQRHRSGLTGGHCKNLLLRDKAKANFLLVVEEERPVDPKAVQALLGCKRLSFARPERLLELLGVEPGAVTPFAVVNDTERAVEVVLERALLSHDRVCFHPLTNTMTTALAPDDLLRFLEAEGHAPRIVDLDAPGG